VRKLQAATVVAVLTMVAIALSSCGGSSGKEGGTLTGSYASFPELDPALSYDQEGWTAMYDTYLPLLTYKHASGAEGAEVVPALAESLPKISNGGKTYTLTLRKGLRYSDGTPVKASDFASTVERLFKINSPGSPFYEGIVGAEQFAKTKSGGISGIKTDDKTGRIEIELTGPRGTFTNELAMLFVALVPPGTPAKNLTTSPPPATGPYEITDVEPGKGWSYVRNPQWAKANGAAIPEVPGHQTFNLYPHDMAKAKKLFAEANPSDRNITVWTDNESPNDKAGAYYAGVLNELGFNAKLKTVNGDNYFGIIGNLSTPDLDTGWADWLQDYPHPNDFFQPLLDGESIAPTYNTNTSQMNDPKLNAKIARLASEELGPKQEEEYAQLDREFMEQAPMAPYGSITTSTFVDDEIELEKVIYNPTMGQDLTSFQFK
jgi:ABC-type transport system substrate-binding protein